MKHTRLLALPTLLAACSGQHPSPQPRPEAYVRPTPLAHTYHMEHNVAVNDSAHTEEGENGGFNIVYPTYGVKVMVSRVATFNVPKTLDNRLERISLNLLGNTSTVTTLTSAHGIGATVVTSPQTVATPVQFVATDSLTWVMSGTAVFARPGTRPDSLMPYVEAIEADMIHLLKQL